MVVTKLTIMLNQLHLLHLFLLLLCFSTLTLSSEPRNPEVEALINIKNGLHDPHGALNNWDEFSVDPCSWAMITCSSDNLVIGLSLQSNNISGKIPPEIGLLPTLQTLDLSNNRFSGEIPVSVEQLSSLQYLDFSYNNLSGPVPKFPAKTFNVAGNPLICRSSPPEICSGSISSSPLSVSLTSSSADKQEEGLQGLGNLRSFTFRELHASTDGFSSKNILGAGGFGNVYRGKLGDGTVVAVKRLKDVNGTTGDSQFRTELEMISLAVHRNLLRLIGYCKTSSERLLVYPYMPNGSARKLHEEMKVEELVDRELGTNYDKIEVGEMLQVALLCTQYLPAHRPKMSEVVLMLEGDGLAERWAASHNHSHFYHANISFKTISSLSTASVSRLNEAHCNDPTYQMFGSSAFDDDDDDQQPLDLLAMELSGPR
ncbi:hypothetical protein Bca4012_022720 [Brassica carinata]